MRTNVFFLYSSSESLKRYIKGIHGDMMNKISDIWDSYYEMEDEDFDEAKALLIERTGGLLAATEQKNVLEYRGGAKEYGIRCIKKAIEHIQSRINDPGYTIGHAVYAMQSSPDCNMMFAFDSLEVEEEYELIDQLRYLRKGAKIYIAKIYNIHR